MSVVEAASVDVCPRKKIPNDSEYIPGAAGKIMLRNASATLLISSNKIQFRNCSPSKIKV